MTTPRAILLTEAGDRTAALLAEAQGWELNRERWQEITRVLDSVEDAVRRRDPDDLVADADNLKRLGPVRIVRIGATHRPEPPPPDVRERLVRIVHELHGLVAAGRTRSTDDHPAGESRG